MEENNEIIEKDTEVKNTTKEEKVSNTSRFKLRKFRFFIVTALILIFTIYSAIIIRADYINALEINEKYTSIVDYNVRVKHIIAVVSFVLIFLIVFINNLFIKGGLKKFFDEDRVEMPKLMNKTFATFFGLLGGIIIPNMIFNNYNLFKNATSFGETPDPIFGFDIGYYMFKLPFYELMIKIYIAVFVGLIVYTALYYIVTLNINLNGVRSETLKKSRLVKQLEFFVIMIMIGIIGYIICFSLNVFTQTMITIGGTKKVGLTGAGAADVKIKLWGYWILCAVIFFSVVRIIVCINKQDFKKGLIAVIIVPVYLICMFVALVMYKNINLKNNQLGKESQYISYNIEKTKKAYGIDILQSTIENSSAITEDEIQKNASLINNIPVISTDIIYKMIENQKDNSIYYTYENTQLARYYINSENKSIYITPREINSADSGSYTNKTYKYTHGYSVIVNSVNDNDGDGYSEYLSSDYSAEHNPLKIKEPRIYFGMNSNSIIAVNTDFGKEYDYPITATTNAENTYDGKAGLNLGFIDRFVLGITNGSLRTAFISNLNENSKIISNTNVLSRVKSIFPYIEYDSKPYLVVSDEGRLIWVIDGYTISNKYPYSQITDTRGPDGYYEKINYIRNSVKVLIDAYDGTTSFYITDQTDPIIMLYKNMYADLFTEEPMPEGISKHFVYPKYLYELQSKIIEIYHDINSDTLYRLEDLWEITPTINNSTSTKSNNVNTSMKPYYTIYKTPDGKLNYGWVIMYNKYSKQNITSYLVGTYEDGENKLKLFKFASNNNVVGISQLNNQIEQDETIASELEKLNTSGTKLTREIKIVPINNTLLYIEPIYQVLLNVSNDTPVLKKVIVASGNRVAIGDNLNQALTNLFTSEAVDINVLDLNDMSGIIDTIIQENDTLTESMNNNDMEQFGKNIDKLRELIVQLKSAREKEKEAESKNEIINNTTSASETNSIFSNYNEVVNNAR